MFFDKLFNRRRHPKQGKTKSSKHLAKRKRLWSFPLALEQLEPRVLLSAASQTWVSAIYLELLQRPVDAGGLAGWSSLADHGVSYAQIVLGIEGSTEYRTKLVNNTYLNLLNRPADSSGLNGWVSYLNNGGTVDQFRRLVIDSSEYFATRGKGTNLGFLQALYIDVLGRPIDQVTEAPRWLRVLSTGLPRFVIVGEIMGGPEAAQHVVSYDYTHYLHRGADQGGLNGWVAALEHGLTTEVLIADFLSSLEYVQKLPSTVPPPPNAVIVWNQAALNAIQQDSTDPLFASRGLAMVQAAVYDAVNAIAGTPAYYVKLSAPAGASAAAAVDAAAHDVLTYLYPAQQATFDALLASQLALVPDGQAKTDGETVGQGAASAIIALRANDGSLNFVTFTSGTAAGDWQPTPPAYAEPLDPQWASLTPFAMTSPDQFRPAGPPDLTSQQWADAVNQVQSLGSVNSTTRTADQTQIARFWNDNAGTYTPPGHWNAIADTVAQQQGDSLVADARLFAELDVSLADAGITAWNTKFNYDTWRPITVIQGGGDGVNPGVTADPTWQPFLTTPNFPEYISGHSTFSGAAATVLDAFFGANVSFTTTEVTLVDSNGNPVVRSFTGFDQAAQEAGLSRIYAGIHFSFSNTDGQAAGKAVANYVLNTFNTTQDTTPPRVSLDNVLPSGASNTNVTITGQTTDNLSGVKLLEVQVDQGAYTPLPFNATTGRFTFTTSFALDGSADGAHTINFRATDVAGNVAAPVAFTFSLGTKVPTLTLTSPTDGGALAAGVTLSGTAATSGPALVALNYAFDAGTRMPVTFSTTDGSFGQALDLSKLAAGPHTLTVTATDAAGNSATQTLHLTLAAPIALTITSLTPADGSTDVGVTFRPKVIFSRPIDTTTLTSTNFYATDPTGAKLTATIVPSDDGTFAWLFFTNPLPGASTIMLIVDGSSIKAADGSLLDAAGTGTPGSKLTSMFTTVSETTVPGTTLSGVLADPGPDLKPMTRDDVRVGPDGILGTADDIYLRPIQGVKVFILGHEDQPTFTDGQGRFSFASVPTGDVKLVLQGNVTGVMTYDLAQQKLVDPRSEGFYFPEMVMDLSIKPGVANTVMGSMGTPAEQAANATALGVYLPRVPTSILHNVSTTQPTTVGLNAVSAPDLTPQQQQELKLTVQPGTMVGMNGQKMTSGQVGVSVVPPELVKDMLPAGVLQHTFDITIQAPGVATFATPAQITFPNVFNAAPGTQLPFLSFDHTTGMLVIDGTATVSADGKTVTTDPGNGITHPGWHGLTPPGDCGGSNGPPPPPPAPTPKDPPPTMSTQVQHFITGNTDPTDFATITFVAPPKIDNGPTPPPGCPVPPRPKQQDEVKEVTIKVDGPLNKFMKPVSDGLPLVSQSFTLAPGSTDKTFGLLTMPYSQLFRGVDGGFAGLTGDQMYGAKIKITVVWHHADGTTTTDIQTYYQYRWVDATDANQAENKTGSTAAFFKTFADGTGGFVGSKSVEVHLPSQVTTSFSSADPFQVDDPVQGESVTLWHFDPLSASNFSQPVTITVNDPKVPNSGQVGMLTATGLGVGKKILSVNLDDPTTGYKAELKRVILSLAEVHIGDPTGPTKVIYVYTNHIAYTQEVDVAADKLVNVLRPDAVEGTDYRTVSDHFQTLFADFMPSQRADPGPNNIPGDADDRFTAAQLAALDALVDQEAAALLTAVQTDYLPIAGAITWQTSNASANVTMDWHDVVSDGAEIYGSSDRNRNEAKMHELIGTKGFTDPVTDTTFNKDIPDVAQQWALAQYLDVNPTSQGDFGVGINLNFTNPATTFAQFVANTVSHELGHTFGLNEGYLPSGHVIGGTAQVRDDGNAYPYNDIMNNGDKSDLYLPFQFPTYSILQASVGMEGSADLPLTAAVSMWRKNYNLATGRSNVDGVGDQRLPSRTPDTNPEISLSGAGNPQVFFGLSGESSALGSVPADGPGGQVLDYTYTLKNDGFAPLTISAIGLANPIPGLSVDTTLVGQTLAPDTSAPLTVHFDPSTPGTINDVLMIQSNAGQSPSFRLPISAVATSEAPVPSLNLVGNNNLGGVAVGSSAANAQLATITNNGVQALVITSILVEGGSSFTLTGVPANLSANPIMLATGHSFTFGVQYSASKVGLERAKIAVATNDPKQPVLRFGVVGTGLDNVVYPHWGHDYVAIEFPNLAGGQILRAVSDDSGNFNFFLPAQQLYHIAIFDPVTGLIAHGYGTTPVSGKGIDLTYDLAFGASTAIDTDGDGLPDDVEFAVGTNPNKVDTSGTGIDDFTKVMQGLDLFGNQPPVTGVIASLALPGTTKAITLQGSPTDPQGQIAYVATGSAGLAIVNASNFQKPVVLGQIALPGDSTGVDVDPNLHIAAVAGNAGGLSFVNVSDPTRPVLLKTVAVNASQVKVVDGVAFAAVDNKVKAYDLLTGELVQDLTLGSATVTGLAQEGNFLYTMDAADTLRVIDLGASGSYMVARGSLTMPAGGGNLFVGNGIAYIAAEGAFFGGFATANVADPDHPALLSGVGNNALDGKAVVANGSGLAVAVGSAGRRGSFLQVDNVADPTNTGALLTEFPLPATPVNVAIGEGIAFVADGTSGLQVVNYQPFDTKGVPPTATVSLPASVIAGTSGSTLQVAEGAIVPVLAAVTDDVQVRNVELLVNGQAVANAVSFPYNFTAALPTLAQDPSGMVTIQLQAIDTGGNVGLSNVLTIQLIKDTTPPQLLASNVPNGATVGLSFRTINLDFSKPLDPATLAAANFTLHGPGGTTLSPEDIVLRRNGASVQLTFPALQAGAYQFVVSAAAITDRVGNALGAANITSSFTVLANASVTWINPGGGFWDDPSNWDTGAVPGTGDNVLINEPSGALITFRTGTAQIHNLSSSDPFTITGGTLQATGTVEVDNTFTITGGTLQGAHVLRGSGGQGVAVTGSGATLDNVTLDADLDISGGALTVRNGLIANGMVRFHGSAFLNFPGTQTLGGTGTVQMDVSAGVILAAGDALTIGPNVTVHGAGSVGGSFSASGAVTNQGTITADTAGKTLTVNVTTFSNAGKLQATGGGSLTVTGLTGSLGTATLTGANSVLSVNGTNYTVNSSFSISNGQTLALLGSWTAAAGVTITSSGATFGLGNTTSLSAISLTNSTLVVQGSYTTAQIQPLLAGNHLVIGPGGVLDNTGNTITLNAGTGSLTLAGGTLKGGTVTASGGAKVVVTGAGSVLDGVTLNADLDLTSTAGTSATVLDGLTLNGTATIGNTGSGFSSTRLTFSGNQTLGGTGTVVLVSSTSFADLLVIGSTLTVGAGITVRGNGTITGATLVNQGTIMGDGSGSALTVTVTSLQNQGTLKAAAGGSLSVSGLTGSLGTAVLSGAYSQLSVNGTGYTVGSSLSINPAQTLALLGSWTATAGVTITGTSATFGLGSTTSLSAISLTNSTLIVQSSYTTAQLQPLLAGNHLAIGQGGVVDNTGATITLNAATGPLTLEGGTLKGGTVTASGGAKVVVTGFGSTLDGVTLNSDLDVSAAGASATVLDGLTLNGTATVGNAATGGGNLTFTGTQLLGGTGTILFAPGHSSGSLSIGTALTLGAGITVHGNGFIFGASLVNQGTIAADSSDSSLTVNVTSLQNQGTLKAAVDGSLTFRGLTGNLGTVVISGANSALSVDGTGYTVNTSLSVSNGQSLTLQGTWSTAAGVTLSADHATLGLGTPGDGTKTWTAGTVTATGATVNLGGSAASLASVSLTNSTLVVTGTYTIAQIQPLLAGNHLVIGQGGVLDNTGATITLSATTGPLTLSGGTLKGGTVSASGGAKVVVTGFGSTLDGVTLNSDLDVTSPAGAFATVLDGLTLNGTATLGNASGFSGATLSFTGAQTLGGTGTVVLAGASSFASQLFVGSTLTLGAGITVRGTGSINGSFNNASLVNQGTIAADSSGSALTVNVTSLQSPGTLKAAAGGSLSLSGLTGTLGTVVVSGANSNLSVTGTNYTVGSSLSVSNGQSLALLGSWTAAAGVTVTASGATLGLGNTTSSSAVSVTNSTLSVQGSYTTAQLQPLLAGNHLSMGPNGVLDNTGATITLNASTGSLTLVGGTFKGGTVTASGGAKVVVTGFGSTLDGVTLNSDLDLTASSASATVLDGLTLNGTATLGSRSGFGSGNLNFTGTQTLGGNATIVFAGPSSSQLTIDANSTLTLGPGVTVHGNNGSVGGLSANGSVVNQGKIAADTNGGAITVNATTFQNQGTLLATGGGSLTVTGLTGSLGTATLTGANSALSVSGTNYTVASSFNISNSQTLDLLGSWTAGAGVTLTASNATLGLGTPGDASQTWNAAGTITATNATLNLGGSAASLATLTATYTAVAIVGTYTPGQLGSVLTGINTLAVGEGGVLDNTGNTLTLDASTGPLTLAGGAVKGGTLKGGTVTASGGAKVIVTGAGSVLDGVTLNGNLDLTAANASATVQDGLTLNGTASVGDPNGQSTASLTFSGDQTLGGSGTLQFGTMNSNNQTNTVVVNVGTILTIGSGITIRGGAATVAASQFSSPGAVVNQGTIDADGSTSSLSFNLASFANLGTIEATTGGTLTVNGLTGGLGSVVLGGANSKLSVDGPDYTATASLSISNGQSLALLGNWTAAAGVTVSATGATFGLGNTTSLSALSLTNSTLIVDGYFTAAQVQPLLAGNHLAIGPGGVLDNTGNTLTLNAATGLLTLDGGTLKGGTVTASGGAKVVVSGSGSVLDGVTLNANLDLTAASAAATVQDGLTLNGTASLGDPSGQFSASLTFQGDQTLGGSGSVQFGTLATNTLGVNVGTNLTIGSGITISGGAGTVGAASPASPGAMVNLGTIDAAGSTSALSCNLASFTNHGTVEATGGGSLSVTGLSGGLGTVVLSGANSQLSLNGTDYTADSSVSISNGQTLALLGTWTAAAGVTLTANGATFGLGNTTSLNALSLTNSTLSVQGNYTTAQVQPLLTGNHLAVGPGGVLDNTSNTLTLTATTGSLTLDGGTLKGGTVTASGGAKVVVTGAGSVLDGVTLNSALDLTAASASATVQDGLTLNGTASVGDPAGLSTASLTFNGSQTLGGSGTLQFGTMNSINQPNTLVVNFGDTLTIGSGITIRGGAGTVGGSNFFGQGAVVNQGTIDADGSGASLSFNLTSFTNPGSIEATNGGSLTVTGLSGGLGTVVLSGANSKLSVNGTNYTVASSLSVSNGQTLALLGSWTAAAGVTVTASGATFGLGNTTSLSSVSLTNSTLIVDGNYTTAQIQSLLAGNHLAIGPDGVLDNTGNTITLNATTGSLMLAGGTLKGGTVSASGGAKVVVTSFGSTLDGVTLNADLDLTGAFVFVTVQDGLTLNGTATIGDPAGLSTASLYFNGSQMLGGTGSVVFGSGNGNLLYVSGGSTLTLGSGITVRGASGTVGGFGGGAVVNQGTVQADTAGGTITIDPGSFVNQGTLAALGGGLLNVTNLAPNTGTLKAGAGSVVTINGLFTQTGTGAAAIDLGGTSSSQFGQVNVTDIARLAGALNVALVNAFNPAVGAAFPVLTYVSHNGTFGTINSGGRTFTATYNGTNLTLTAN